MKSFWLKGIFLLGQKPPAARAAGETIFDKRSSWQLAAGNWSKAEPEWSPMASPGQAQQSALEKSSWQLAKAEPESAFSIQITPGGETLSADPTKP